MRVIKYIASIFVWLAAFGCVAWAFAALHFDFPAANVPIAILFILILVTAVIFVRGKLLKMAMVFAGFALVVSWWLTLKPTNNRP
jgi:hypothetical protein